MIKAIRPVTKVSAGVFDIGIGLSSFRSLQKFNAERTIRHRPYDGSKGKPSRVHRYEWVSNMSMTDDNITLKIDKINQTIGIFVRYAAAVKKPSL